MDSRASFPPGRCRCRAVLSSRPAGPARSMPVIFSSVVAARSRCRLFLAALRWEGSAWVVLHCRFCAGGRRVLHEGPPWGHSRCRDHPPPLGVPVSLPVTLAPLPRPPVGGCATGAATSQHAPPSRSRCGQQLPAAPGLAMGSAGCSGPGRMGRRQRSAPEHQLRLAAAARRAPGVSRDSRAR